MHRKQRNSLLLIGKKSVSSRLTFAVFFPSSDHDLTLWLGSSIVAAVQTFQSRMRNDAAMIC
ncbi:MAG: hypothetical protein DMG54_30655 [Acidobacteria bacterium]|nr:MAG: hypothetical protein DMG54_30655 [Acidobacteriota bacterium]